jgi:hypothetical protein
MLASHQSRKAITFRSNDTNNDKVFRYSIIRTRDIHSCFQTEVGLSRAPKIVTLKEYCPLSRRISRPSCNVIDLCTDSESRTFIRCALSKNEVARKVRGCLLTRRLIHPAAFQHHRRSDRLHHRAVCFLCGVVFESIADMSDLCYNCHTCMSFALDPSFRIAKVYSPPTSRMSGASQRVHELRRVWSHLELLSPRSDQSQGRLHVLRPLPQLSEMAPPYALQRGIGPVWWLRATRPFTRVLRAQSNSQRAIHH